MKRIAVWSALLSLVFGGAALAYGLAQADAGRTDSPGTVVCPITGDEVCKDHCPLLKADCPDCPGKIVCPITGEPTCHDESPLAKVADATNATPACCRTKPLAKVADATKATPAKP